MPAYQKVIWAALGITVLAILVLGYFLFLAPAGQGKIHRQDRAYSPANPQADGIGLTAACGQ